jgi:hypothetical protein
MANGVFQNYPDYNFSISGLSNPSANTFYGYAGFAGGKHFWNSLDDAFTIYYENNNWYFKALNNDFNLVSNQQNVDWPWNVTSWTLQSGELDGTPVFALVSFNKSNIDISGLGNSGVEGIDLNGTYVLGYRGFGDWWGDAAEEEVGISSQRPFYVKTNGYSSENFGFENWSYILRYFGYQGVRWWIYNLQVPGGYLFTSEQNVLPYYPTDIVWSPTEYAPTGTPVLTFSDPVPDPYARWGGYANYARMRLLEYC